MRDQPKKSNNEPIGGYGNLRGGDDGRGVVGIGTGDPSWQHKLDNEERRKKSAVDAFNAAEYSRKKLVSLLKFWMGFSGLMLATLIFILIAWLSK